MKLREIFLIVLCLMFGSWALVAQPLSVEIHSGWKFKQARLTDWYPATVPGVVHMDLINNSLIEDPFYRMNERGMQWIDKEDWIYETKFDVSAEIFAMRNIILRFKGLDTFADVYLNDEKVLEADNMFREWKVDVKDKVKSKDNVLRVYFHTPTGTALKKSLEAPVRYQAANDQSEHGGFFDFKVSMFARKAGYHFGWDWGPRLATSGMWRPVTLEGWNDVRLEDVYIKQNNVSAKRADITTQIDLSSTESLSGVSVVVSDEQSGKVYGVVSADLKRGENRLSVDFVLNNPRLWWSNGLGNPNMYSFKIEVKQGGDLKESSIVKSGIRSLKLIRESDSDGRSFYFELNGKPVFAKGANYIPCDNLLPRVTEELYRKTLQDAADANMNMVRIWGGGIYENDIFYNLCDEMGLMVWHDFMFACCLYPAQGEFLENIRQEAIYNVKRLRNHPSIAVWCGNNEIQEGWFGWGDWQSKYSKADKELVWGQSTNLFNKVLPEVVAEYSETAYTPTSPFSRYDGISERTSGDLHYWEVWFARRPITDYDNEKARFFSEYGFQSFPTYETAMKFAPEKQDHDPLSEVMMFHQRSSKLSNKLMSDYLEQEIHKPKDFESFIYMSHVLQGYAVKTAIESHRRNMPYCMGTLFWQHNDCWPSVSWSSRDFYGRWKALQYYSIKAYDDILVSPLAEDGRLNVYVVSDRLQSEKAKLYLEVYTLDGKLLTKLETGINVKANSSNVVVSHTVESLLKGELQTNVVIHARLVDSKGKRFTNNYLLHKPAEIALPKVDVKYDIKSVDGGYEVTLTSSKFAKAVYMTTAGDDFFEDNYFDILPGESKTVKVKSVLDRGDFANKFNVVSLVDSY